MKLCAIDFDGTLVTHAYPVMGEDIGAVEWVLQAQELGVSFILLTMRNGVELEQAIDWCEEQGINLVAANDNAPGADWSSSRKVYAHRYIDDAALGTPLIQSPLSHRPYVNWVQIGPQLLEWAKSV